MLGRLRRTTRTDVSLALVLAGIVYLTWASACWSAKESAANLKAVVGNPPRQLQALAQVDPPPVTRWFMNTFGSRACVAFDVAGPIWMFAGLWLVIRASGQRRIISWSWLLVSCQGIAAVAIAVWAALAQELLISSAVQTPGTAGTFQVSWSPVVVGIAVLIWVGTLAWLLFQRLWLQRHLRSAAIGDGYKTHAYRR